MGEQRPLGATHASALVVASMIGTGVYTTSGIMLAEGRTPLGVLAVWLVAGLLSLAGALSYAELASVFPESGGEYALLSRIFHPAVGFVAGIASVVLGFAAPIAACGIAFARYAGAALGYPPDAVTAAEQPVALAIVAIVSLAHALGIDAIAEGVESEEQADRLRELGCELAQGYLLGKPKPAALIGAAQPAA